MARGMLRFKNFDELPTGLKDRLRAKLGVRVRTKSMTGPKPDDEKRSFSLELYQQLVAAGIEPPIREYHFDQQEHEGRRWAFDLAWPELRFAIEVDGMAHRIKGRFRGDIERQQAAFLAGWRVFRVSPRDVETGRGLELSQWAIGLVRSAQAATADDVLPLPWSARSEAL